MTGSSVIGAWLRPGDSSFAVPRAPQEADGDQRKVVAAHRAPQLRARRHGALAMDQRDAGGHRCTCTASTSTWRAGATGERSACTGETSVPSWSPTSRSPERPCAWVAPGARGKLGLPLPLPFSRVAPRGSARPAPAGTASPAHAEHQSGSTPHSMAGWSSASVWIHEGREPRRPRPGRRARSGCWRSRPRSDSGLWPGSAMCCRGAAERPLIRSSCRGRRSCCSGASRCASPS